MLRKNCSRFWSCVSPPWTANARKGLPSLSARLGVSVERGRLPGVTTLNGDIASSRTNDCIRWLMPTPVVPAMVAGIQPPLGVTDTTQPSSSAASIDVVPAVNPSSNVRLPSFPVALGGGGGQLASRPRYGFDPPWNGYGSPGLTFGSFFSQSISVLRSRAYSLDNSPLIGVAGGM